MDMAEFKDEPEVLVKIRQLIGGEPRSAIVLGANDIRGSKILAVQFAALCAERYPCVVYQADTQVLVPAHEVLSLRDAGKGFDGYTWETAEPGLSFSWLDSWLREEFGDAFEGQMLAGSDMHEGRNKKQLGA